MKTLQFDGLVVSDRDIIDLLESQKHKISREKLILFYKKEVFFAHLLLKEMSYINL